MEVVGFVVAICGLGVGLSVVGDGEVWFVVPNRREYFIFRDE